MEKNKIMMIVIIVLLVVLLVAIGFVGYTIVGVANQNSEGDTEKNNTQVAVDLKPSEYQVIALESPISTNLKTGPDGEEHSMRVSIALAIDYRDPKAADEFVTTVLTGREVVVRDVAISVINSKTYEELKANDAKVLLSKEILIGLQEKFDTNLIYDVFISDIYYQ